MKRWSTLSAPVAIAAIGGLSLGTAGTAVAGHLITGKDIKNHSITTVDLSKSTVKALNPTSTAWYGAHMDVLNTTAGSEGYGTPVGYSAEEGSSDSFVRVIGPTHATVLTSLQVSVQNAPGTTSVRNFYLVVNGKKSLPCTMNSADLACSAVEHMTIPASAEIYLESDVATADADGADASIGWTTAG